VHEVKEEADVCDAASDTSSLKEEYIVGIKYESQHGPVVSTESKVSSVLDVLNMNEDVILLYSHN
jgi:hypothetical protein